MNKSFHFDSHREYLTWGVAIATVAYMIFAHYQLSYRTFVFPFVLPTQMIIVFPKTFICSLKHWKYHLIIWASSKSFEDAQRHSFAQVFSWISSAFHCATLHDKSNLQPEIIKGHLDSNENELRNCRRYSTEETRKEFIENNTTTRSVLY